MSRLQRNGAVSRTLGLRPPEAPPAGADAITVCLHYLTAYETDYARARQVVKRRASHVVVGAASANGLIAVAGVVVALTELPWVGLISTALAGFVGVLAAWDGLFRHRELWVQRSLILGQLQAVQREVRLRSSLGENPGRIAEDGMARLNGILAEDLVTWAEIRRSHPTDRQEGQGQGPENTALRR